MILHDVIESLLRGIDGPVGRRFRAWYYRRRLKSCGRDVCIDSGVYIIHPEKVTIGDNVWLDKRVILIAGEAQITGRPSRNFPNSAYSGQAGEIRIGSDSHIGIDTLIQGHGGVSIGREFTTSAGCKIYSMSNDPGKCRTGTMKDPAYVMKPVVIGDNVWLGLNVVVLGCHIHDDVFIRPNTVVYRDIPANVIHGGAGYSQIRRFPA